MIPQHGTLEISRSRVLHNLNLIRRHLGPKTQLCATLKADAYGHGLVQLAKILNPLQVSWIAVYNLAETLHLPPFRNFNILVLAPLVLHDWSLSSQTQASLTPQIRFNIVDVRSAQNLSFALRSAGIGLPVPIHIQIDTGLTRSGAAPALVPELAAAISDLPNLFLEGLFAHFSHADVPGDATIQQQAARFHSVADPLKALYPHLLLHLQNSAAAWNLSDPALDIARIGIALYGLQPSTAHRIEGLLPIAQLTAHILAIHEVPADTGVGYGHTFITRRPSRLAIVPVGYAEGYPRALSNRGIAQVLDTNVPVVGRVSMDQVILDITDVPAAKIGACVTLISWDPDQPNSLDHMADATGTIGYELATGLGARLHRLIVA